MSREKASLSPASTQAREDNPAYLFLEKCIDRHCHGKIGLSPYLAAYAYHNVMVLDCLDIVLCTSVFGIINVFFEDTGIWFMMRLEGYLSAEEIALAQNEYRRVQGITPLHSRPQFIDQVPAFRRCSSSPE